MRNARCDFVSLSASQWYPIWLGYAGAWLEQCGHEVNLLDAPSAGLDHEAADEAVTAWRPDMLVVYTGQKSRDSDIEVADRLTEKLKCITVLVGPYFSARRRVIRFIDQPLANGVHHVLTEYLRVQV